MYQKVHLLLNHIMLRRVMDSVWEVRECIALHSAFQNYTTVIFSTELFTHKLKAEYDVGGGPETKDLFGVA